MVITQDLLITCFCNIWIDRQSIVVGNVQVRLYVLCTYTCQQYIWPASSCGGCSLCTRALLHLVSQIMQLHFQHDWFQSLPLEICSSCFIPFWVIFVQIKGEGHRQNHKNRKQWQTLSTQNKGCLCQDSQDRKLNYSGEPFSYNFLLWYKKDLPNWCQIITLCDIKCCQNILFRFGDSHNLLFALPNSGAGHDKQVLTKQIIFA